MGNEHRYPLVLWECGGGGGGGGVRNMYMPVVSVLCRTDIVENLCLQKVIVLCVLMRIMNFGIRILASKITKQDQTCYHAMKPISKII